jgi:hypothetical protein
MPKVGDEQWVVEWFEGHYVWDEDDERYLQRRFPDMDAAVAFARSILPKTVRGCAEVIHEVYIYEDPYERWDQTEDFEVVEESSADE